MNKISKFTNRFMKIAGISIAALALVILPGISRADTLTRNLSVGSTGTEVSSLQTFLATDATIYPQGLVTGYFGFLTKSAVSNFQSKNSLTADGIVGPMSRSVINQQMINGMGGNSQAPMISDVIINTTNSGAMVNWTTNEGAKGVVYYSTSPLSTYEHENSVDISGSTAMTDSSLRTTQNISVQNLQSNTTYYYMIYTTDQAGNVSVTIPATFHTSN